MRSDMPHQMGHKTVSDAWLLVIANLIYSLVRVHLRTYLLPSMYPTIYVEGILSLSDLSRQFSR